MEIVWHIYKREYLHLIRKRSFILSTLLLPLGLALIVGIQAIAFIFVEEEHFTVFVQSEMTHISQKHLISTETIQFQRVNEPLAKLRTMVGSGNEIVWVLPDKKELSKTDGPIHFQVYSKRDLRDPIIFELKSRTTRIVKDFKIEQAGLTLRQLDQLNFRLEEDVRKWEGKDTRNVNTDFASFVGMGIGLLMYLLVGIYGTILMQGVIQEKTNRIVEIMVSSVRPFYLLLGKVLGLASVAITQLILWGVLCLIGLGMVSLLAGGALDGSLSQLEPNSMSDVNIWTEIKGDIAVFDWSILFIFPFYFLGGFFLFGSLFAAAAASVDNIQDAQPYTLPITLLLLLPILLIGNIIQNPSSGFAVFAGHFPFFSSIVMPVRMSLMDVAWYEILLSLFILNGSFVLSIWFASRVYRIGILMYGKRPRLKEILHWVRYP